MEELGSATLERRLRQHVSFLCDEIGVRSVLTYANLCRAERYVHLTLEQAGDRSRATTT